MAWTAPGLAADAPAALASAVVAADSAAPPAGYDGVVEAVRRTVVSAQVPGAVVELLVAAGDRVRAGQVLLRLDARAAEQQAGAAAAQLQAARAADEAATKELDRQRQLFQKHYISQAALDRAEAQYKAAKAQAAANALQEKLESTLRSLNGDVRNGARDGTAAGMQAVLGALAAKVGAL